MVTGASSDIGEAIARALAKAAWATVLVAPRADRLTALAVEIGGQPLELDFAKGQSEALTRVPRCDLLVNCGSGAFGMDTTSETALEDWRDMFEVNVVGTLRVTPLLLPKLVAAQGCIVNVTSTAALHGYEGGSSYFAAKNAVRALTQALRLELTGGPVRVTEVLVGMAKSEGDLPNRFDNNAARDDVDGALLLAEDVAAVVTSIAELPRHINVDEVVVRPVAHRYRGALSGHVRGPAPQPKWV